MINEEYFDSFPVLNSKRLILRKFKLDDDKDIFEIRSSPKVMRHMDSHPHADSKASRKFIADNISSFEKGENLAWAICLKSDEQLIGDISFWKITRDNARVEIGYSLKEEYWGQGYMSESMEVLFDFAFEQFNVHSIEANINPSNNNSRNLLLKQGFKKEAYFREHYYFDGKFTDSEIYSLLKQDRSKNKL